MASGFNGTISARGHGTRRLRVMGLEFGLNIIATSDNQARTRRAFYPLITTGSSFTMTVGFVSWEEREGFNRWMSNFMDDVSSGTARYGTQTVVVPSRDFQRVAVPESEIEYGEGVGDMLYLSSVKFIGASDPLNTDLTMKQMGTAYYTKPRGSSEAQFFHPLGTQVAGAESLGETIFDTTPFGPDPLASNLGDLGMGPRRTNREILP